MNDSCDFSLTERFLRDEVSIVANVKVLLEIQWKILSVKITNSCQYDGLLLEEFIQCPFCYKEHAFFSKPIRQTKKGLCTPLSIKYFFDVL